MRKPSLDTGTHQCLSSFAGFDSHFLCNSKLYIHTVLPTGVRRHVLLGTHLFFPAGVFVWLRTIVLRQRRA